MHSGTGIAHQDDAFGRVTDSGSHLTTSRTLGVRRSRKAVSYYVKRAAGSAGKIDPVGKSRKSCSPPLCLSAMPGHPWHTSAEIERKLMPLGPPIDLNERDKSGGIG